MGELNDIPLPVDSGLRRLMAQTDESVGIGERPPSTFAAEPARRVHYLPPISLEYNDS